MNTIVMTRSGAILSVFPAIPGAGAIASFSELETVFPGLAAQIEKLLSGAPAGGFERTVALSDGRSVLLIVVETLTIQRVECDVAQIVKDALAPLERQAQERDVSLKFEIEGNGPHMARLDPVKITWVISALAGNSLRFVKSGSRHLPGGSITVRAAPNGEMGTMEFDIQDDGPGIPPAVMEEILEQSAGSPPFRGVALRLARDIVHAHGGSFFVYSVEEGMDRGTTIHFKLPIEGN
jgi:signal transduction histidine kinase